MAFFVDVIVVRMFVDINGFAIRAAFVLIFFVDNTRMRHLLRALMFYRPTFVAVLLTFVRDT